MTPFRPMLAAVADLSSIRYPIIASAKLDGVRALVMNGVVVSRTLKPIPNMEVQARFKHLEGYDGELILGSPTAWDCYRKTVSVVMADRRAAHDVNYHVFDNIEEPTLPYVSRLALIVPEYNHEHFPLYGTADLLALEEKFLAAGYEGLILRDPSAPYKNGRSTVKQGWMLKVKQFTDAEATVIGFTELESNENPAELDERGYTKHSHHQANKTKRDTLGALVVVLEGQQFSIGTGFTQAERQEIWGNKQNYLGRIAKFKYFSIGMKDSPRHPVWLGWRDKIDV